MLIQLTDCTLGYARRPVITVEELRVDSGRCLGIYGPNGSGKTTLVGGLTGLLRPLNGNVSRGSGIRFGYLPQHRAMGLHWPMTAFDAAALPSSALSILGRVDAQRRQRIRQSMAMLEVEPLYRRRFAQLSGGQQQRVLLAGVLAVDPKVLLLDEPTDGLDAHSRQLLLGALAGATAAGIGTVLISHDVDDVAELCHRVALVHPAPESDEPSRVEVLDKGQFVARLAVAGGLR
ncbi:MAG TPA: ATP-binding cassette domain-containing protein [Tepidisphaeraceae bacterium]|jgi:ABC-type Mn2+/Zn2+ transport system ATPase subunit